ncbi:Zona pellucida sperm-binding protein 3 receptor [Lemmus lemmus]
MCSPRALHPLTKSSTLNRKGIKIAWSFLELWKTSHSVLFQMTLATVLMAPVLGDCGLPPTLAFASPINELYGTTFSTGTILKYACHHGFRKVNSSHLTCDENGSWVYTVFCVKKRCRNPGELVNGKVEITTDLFLGSTIDFSCAKGCDPNFTLLGNASIVCTVVNKTLGVWSPNPPACQIICHQPQIPGGGDLAPGFRQLYMYKDSVEIRCKKGSVLSGSSVIRCEANNGCADVPDIPYASWEGNKFPLRNFQIFEIGTKLKYQCKPGYRPVLMEPQIVTCQKNLTWTPSKGCERACCPTPNMDKIRIVSERRDFTGICIYAYGDYVFYICAEGSYPMSTDGRSSCQADGRWEPAIPSCQGGKTAEGTCCHHFPDIPSDSMQFHEEYSS